MTVLWSVAWDHTRPMPAIVRKVLGLATCGSKKPDGCHSCVLYTVCFVAGPVHGRVRILVHFIIGSDKLYFTCARKKKNCRDPGRSKVFAFGGLPLRRTSP